MKEELSLKLSETRRLDIFPSRANNNLIIAMAGECHNIGAECTLEQVGQIMECLGGYLPLEEPAISAEPSTVDRLVGMVRGASKALRLARWNGYATALEQGLQSLGIETKPEAAAPEQPEAGRYLNLYADGITSFHDTKEAAEDAAEHSIANGMKAVLIARPLCEQALTAPRTVIEHLERHARLQASFAYRNGRHETLREWDKAEECHANREIHKKLFAEALAKIAVAAEPDPGKVVKHGPCGCKSSGDDICCPTCGGSGWALFGPYTVSVDIGSGDSTHTTLVVEKPAREPEIHYHPDPDEYYLVQKRHGAPAKYKHLDFQSARKEALRLADVVGGHFTVIRVEMVKQTKDMFTVSTEHPGRDSECPF